MATSGPGFDVPGEWFIGCLNTTSLVLGHMRATLKAALGDRIRHPLPEDPYDRVVESRGKS